MRKFMFAAALSVAAPLCVPSDAHALGRRSKATRTTATRVTTTATVTTRTAITTTYPASYAVGRLAQWKAEVQAVRGLRAVHFGGGTHEGCGFSTVSADDAVRHCCYYGQLPIREVGVSRGLLGWHATVIYGGATCVNGNCK